MTIRSRMAGLLPGVVAVAAHICICHARRDPALMTRVLGAANRRTCTRFVEAQTTRARTNLLIGRYTPPACCDASGACWIASRTTCTVV
jgi:hypothetical protein